MGGRGRKAVVLVLLVAVVAVIVVVLVQRRPEPLACKPLVVFYSGFASQTKETLLWELCENYARAGVTKRCLPYSEDGVDMVVAHWNSTPAKTPIVLIGHSWGGDTAYEVAEQLPPVMAPTLVTLDPVGGQA